MKAGLGLEGEAESMTHRELQARRKEIQEKVEKSGTRFPGIDIGS